MTRALLVPVLGPARIEDRELNSVGTDSLHLLNEWVGGYIEAIYGPGWHAYVNEEGKLEGFPFNERAHELARAFHWQFAGADFLVGTVVFLGSGPATDPLEHDCPQPLIDWMREHYGQPFQ